MPENEGIQDIADILERQRPLRAVERVQFAPAPDVQPFPAGNHEQAHQQAQGKLPAFHLQSLRKSSSGEKEHRRSHERTGNHHRMQSRETAFEEPPGGHPVPTVIVGIPHDEAAQHKEEIHRQIAMVDDLIGWTPRISFENVEQHHH